MVKNVHSCFVNTWKQIFTGSCANLLGAINRKQNKLDSLSWRKTVLHVGEKSNSTYESMQPSGGAHFSFHFPRYEKRSRPPFHAADLECGEFEARSAMKFKGQQKMLARARLNIFTARFSPRYMEVRKKLILEIFIHKTRFFPLMFCLAWWRIPAKLFPLVLYTFFCTLKTFLLCALSFNNNNYLWY